MASSIDVSLANSIKLLLENSSDIFLDASNMLIKLATNILNDPQNQKFRQLRVGNPNVQKRLLPVSGAMECLLDMGFEEDGEFFTLPATSMLDNLQRITNELRVEREKLLKPPKKEADDITSGMQPIASSSSPQPQSASTRAAPEWASEIEFWLKLTSALDLVQRYERQDLQAKALACMPLAQLHASTGTTKDEDPEEQLLLRLLAWFKAEFFTWVNAPPCCTCGGTTVSAGSGVPTESELNDGASRVEVYRCEANCREQTRFPRFNNPARLLETRRGRCGEWANVFTLCCRAVGLEARYVLDWTDHVWTEVYSKRHQRWLHCDSCEAACDRPLLYEAGWGKHLTYVLAVSHDDIQDVTWRYVASPPTTLTRRTLCREAWLVLRIISCRKRVQASVTTDRQNLLQRRLVAELVELMQPPVARDGDLAGRVSGSLAWRHARGETGTANPVVIRPTDVEIAQRVLHLCYDCASDQYTRLGSQTNGWHQMVFSGADDIQRKVELDWNMCYLARREGATSARLTWKFDFTDSRLVVDTVEVQALSTCFEDGQVLERICSDDQCAILPPDGVHTVFHELSGSSAFTLTVEMRRGKGSNAWQHTQLFRQSMRDKNVYPFDVKVTLKSRT